MNDRIANSLKQHVPADIGLRLGLTGSQMDTCFALASRVTAEVVQGSVLKEPEAVRSLLSKEANTPEASKVARRISLRPCTRVFICAHSRRGGGTTVGGLFVSGFSFLVPR